MEEILSTLNILKKRWPWAGLAFICFFYLIGIRRAMNTVPLYRAEGTIIFDESISPDLTDPFSFTDQNNLINNLIQIKSESLAKQVQKDLPNNIERNFEDHEELLEDLIAMNPDESDVIKLSYTNENPQTAAAIINTWIRNYVELDKQQQIAQSKELARFLEKQIPLSQRNLEDTAGKLKDFKQDNRILDIGAEASSTIQIIGELDSQIARIQAELAAQRSKRDSFKEIFPVDSKTIVNSSFINESPVINSLITQIQEVKTKIEQEKLRFGDNHPQVITLVKQEEILQQQLKEYVPNIFIDGNTSIGSLDNIYQPGQNQSALLAEYASTERQIQSLQAQLSSLNQLIDIYRQRVDTLPNLEFKQQQLQRELTARDELLQNLVKTYQEAQIAINSTQSTVRNIELASIPDEPAINRKFTFLFQGFLAGIIMGIIAAYVRDKLDNGINNVDQVKEYFDLPVLAEIPDFQKHTGATGKKDQEELTNLPVKDNPKSPISEAFRGLCTSIKFMDTEDKSSKIITISSSVAGEGKSTISANTAIAASELGGKVLLIEADLRKPGQRKIWENIDQQEGLGDLLQTNHNLDWSSLTINVHGNLDVLPAGKSKSNPVALIGSPQMVHLIEELKQEYRWIVIDAPPVSVAADAQILARMSDGLLMVVRQGKVNTSMLEAVSQSLKQAEINVLGVLLNCFSSGSGGYYYYNYYYNYSYYYDNKESKGDQGKSSGTSKLGKIFSNRKSG